MVNINFDKKGQLQLLSNPKTIVYILGGALIGYFFFQTTQAAIIGGIVGLFMSFAR